MRCGTTSLTTFLRQREDVHVSRPKELHYFDRHYARGPAWYAQQFRPSPGQTAVGEATPNYLYDPLARRRMAQDLKSSRFVIILRNPVDRAYSHYWLARENGREQLSFAAAISAEPQRLRGADPITASHFSYIDRGKYVDQIEDLTSLLGHSDIGVWILEEIRSDPNRNLRQILEFIGANTGDLAALTLPSTNSHHRVLSPRLRARGKRLPTWLGKAVSKANTSKRPYSPMSKEMREELEAVYEPFNRRIEGLLGRPIDAWLPAGGSTG